MDTLCQDCKGLGVINWYENLGESTTILRVCPACGGYPAIDWRWLLRRYIDHVWYNEGTVFLSDTYRRTSARAGITFTDVEWSALQALDAAAEE